MKAKWIRSKKNQGPKKKARRTIALAKREEELKKGFLNNGEWIEYDEKDKKRIAKEINNLKAKL